MPLPRTYLKTAPADLHLLHAGGTLMSQCRPGDSTTNSFSSKFVPDGTHAALEVERGVTFQVAEVVKAVEEFRQQEKCQVADV